MRTGVFLSLDRMIGGVPSVWSQMWFVDEFRKRVECLGPFPIFVDPTLPNGTIVVEQEGKEVLRVTGLG